MDLHPPPVGFKYVIDAAGRVVLDQATGKPKVIPIDSASPGPSPLADTNKLAPPSESIGATATLVPPRPTTPKSVAGSDTNKLAPPSQSIGATATLVPPRPTTPKSVAESETTRSDTKSTRSDAKSKKVEIFDFVPEAAKQIKNSTKQTFDGVTDFANNIVDDPGDAAQDALRGMSTFVQDFFKFISRGNVIDLAVGIIVGNAFTYVFRVKGRAVRRFGGSLTFRPILFLCQRDCHEFNQ